jgi:8-oxo-dGTP pyrophosphatase MutT (NUDIX family)
VSDRTRSTFDAGTPDSAGSSRTLPFAHRPPTADERWTVLETAVVERSHWLTLERQRIGLPHGGELPSYYRIEGPDVVTVFALTVDDEIVLVEQYRHGIEAVIAELPAGMVDASDESATAAIRRELREETGYEAAEIELLGTLAMSAPRQRNLLHCFLARGCRKVGEPGGDPAERIQVRLEPRSRLNALVCRGILPAQTSLACAYLAALRLGESHQAR